MLVAQLNKALKSLPARFPDISNLNSNANYKSGFRSKITKFQTSNLIFFELKYCSHKTPCRWAFNYLKYKFQSFTKINKLFWLQTGTEFILLFRNLKIRKRGFIVIIIPIFQKNDTVNRMVQTSITLI